MTATWSRNPRQSRLGPAILEAYREAVTASLKAMFERLSQARASGWADDSLKAEGAVERAVEPPGFGRAMDFRARHEEVRRALDRRREIRAGRIDAEECQPCVLVGPLGYAELELENRTVTRIEILSSARKLSIWEISELERDICAVLVAAEQRISGR